MENSEVQLEVGVGETADAIETLLIADIPHIIKYMGSKKPIINYVTSAINEIHCQGEWVCDLFAGSCSISAALRRRYNFISNDIQNYSRILAHTYFSDLSSYNSEELIEQIDTIVSKHLSWFEENYNDFFFDYSKVDTIEEYQRIELSQRALYTDENFETDFHLFTKYYSGTYWSFEQCVWIDALRKTAEHFHDAPVYYAILSSIMFAMSYSTQSTGHFAQYRDGNTDEAVNNIIYYRQKSLYDLFKKKLKELVQSLDNSLKELEPTTLSFEECLANIPEKSTVYADPPYAPVHYSRFYHALETLIKYDYPVIDYKGRYRSDRHQSPFSQKSKALQAFETMFLAIIKKSAQMVLSYSASGVVLIEELIALSKDKFEGSDYYIIVRTLDHKHSTLGRFEDHEREVIEYLIIAKLKQNVSLS